jgi:hypothetical protein
MKFAEILEYMETVPPSPADKFYFDYNMMLGDDPNINELLLCDLEYVIFYKKKLTISQDLTINTGTICPDCKLEIPISISLTDIRFKRLGEQLLNGFHVDFNGSYHNVSMPTVGKFMEIFTKYKMFKRITDMNIIKLIALFDGIKKSAASYEDMVVNATHEGISVLVALDNLYYRTIEPIRVECPDCKHNFNRLKTMKMDSISAINELDMEERLKELRGLEYGGITVGINDLIVNFFREVVTNNPLTDAQIVPGKILEDEQPGELHPNIPL